MPHLQIILISVKCFETNFKCHPRVLTGQSHQTNAKCKYQWLNSAGMGRMLFCHL